MQWVRKNMNVIDLVDGNNRIDFIAFTNFRWTLFEGGTEWGVDLKVYNTHQVEEAQMAAVEELIRHHSEKAKLFRKARKEMMA